MSGDGGAGTAAVPCEPDSSASACSACAAAVAELGVGSVEPAGTGEPGSTPTPPRTHSSSSGPPRSGADAYRVRYDYYENNTLKAPSPVVNPWPTPTPGRAPGRTGAGWRRSSTAASTASVRRASTRSRTTRCSSRTGRTRARWARCSGARAYTTIDRSKPTAALQARGQRGLREGHEDPHADSRLRRRRRRTVSRELPLLRGRRRSEQPVRHERKGKIYGHNAACSVPGERREVDDLHLHGRLRLPRDRGRERVGLRDRGRRLDPGQPERAQPERTRPTRPTCPSPACDGVVLDRTAADGRNRRGRDRGEGRRPERRCEAHGHRRHVGRGRRRSVDLGRQHRRRQR